MNSSSSAPGGANSRFEFDKRALVLNPIDQSMQVKKTKKLESENVDSESYFAVELPRRHHNHDCWDIFMGQEDGKIWVRDANDQSTEGYYLGRLDLQRLGFKNQLFRRRGVLSAVYIPKTTTDM